MTVPANATMKDDGRELDHKTLEGIRRVAVQRVREGEAPSEVIASYSFHRTSIYRWLNAAAGRGRLTLHFLPGYAPDLNPDELVWSYLKRTGTARRPLRAGERLKEKIHAELAAIQRNRKLVRSFFQAPSVSYITDF